jgi:hypothetical protein
MYLSVFAFLAFILSFSIQVQAVRRSSIAIILATLLILMVLSVNVALIVKVMDQESHAGHGGVSPEVGKLSFQLIFSQRICC